MPHPSRWPFEVVDARCKLSVHAMAFRSSYTSTAISRSRSCAFRILAPRCIRVFRVMRIDRAQRQSSSSRCMLVLLPITRIRTTERRETTSQDRATRFITFTFRHLPLWWPSERSGFPKKRYPARLYKSWLQSYFSLRYFSRSTILLDKYIYIYIVYIILQILYITRFYFYYIHYLYLVIYTRFFYTSILIR